MLTYLISASPLKLYFNFQSQSTWIIYIYIYINFNTEADKSNQDNVMEIIYENKKEEKRVFWRPCNPSMEIIYESKVEILFVWKKETDK